MYRENVPRPHLDVFEAHKPGRIKSGLFSGVAVFLRGVGGDAAT